jgi:hypothetical protein
MSKLTGCIPPLKWRGLALIAPKKLPYPSDLWNFNVQGRVVYYFGEDIENAEDYTLNLPIQVKTESYLPEKTMPGFEAANLEIKTCILATNISKERIGTQTMATLKDSVVINRSPEAVFEWFAHFTENYRAWHKDHVLAKWVKGQNFEKGSVLYAEEYLGGKLEKLSFEITSCVRNELIEYKVLFPESLICSGGSFSIKPSNGGSVFTAALSFRFGGLLSKVAGKRVEDIRGHMKEEGENLKMLLENGEKM